MSSARDDKGTYIPNLDGMDKFLRVEKKVLTNLPPIAPITEFDSVLFQDIKLKDFPRFLWQHCGMAGYVRLSVWKSRKMSYLGHPFGGTRMLQNFLLYLGCIVVISQWPFLLYFNKERDKAILTRKYGDYEVFKKKHPIERGYIIYALHREYGHGH